MHNNKFKYRLIKWCGKVVSALFGVYSSFALALPTGGVYTYGGGTITQNATTMNIAAGAGKNASIIDFSTYGVGVGEAVNYSHSGANHSFFNFIGENHSYISGAINAMSPNTSVYLFSPGGITVNTGAQINVTGNFYSGYLSPEQRSTLAANIDSANFNGVTIDGLTNLKPSLIVSTPMGVEAKTEILSGATVNVGGNLTLMNNNVSGAVDIQGNVTVAGDLNVSALNDINYNNPTISVGGNISLLAGQDLNSGKTSTNSSVNFNGDLSHVNDLTVQSGFYTPESKVNLDAPNLNITVVGAEAMYASPTAHRDLSGLNFTASDKLNLTVNTATITGGNFSAQDMSVRTTDRYSTIGGNFTAVNKLDVSLANEGVAQTNISGANITAESVELHVTIPAGYSGDNVVDSVLKNNIEDSIINTNNFTVDSVRGGSAAPLEKSAALVVKSGSQVNTPEFTSNGVNVTFESGFAGNNLTLNNANLFFNGDIGLSGDLTLNNSRVSTLNAFSYDGKSIHESMTVPGASDFEGKQTISANNVVGNDSSIYFAKDPNNGTSNADISMLDLNAATKATFNNTSIEGISINAPTLEVNAQGSNKFNFNNVTGDTATFTYAKVRDARNYVMHQSYYDVNSLSITSDADLTIQSQDLHFTDVQNLQINATDNVNIYGRTYAGGWSNVALNAENTSIHSDGNVMFGGNYLGNDGKPVSVSATGFINFYSLVNEISNANIVGGGVIFNTLRFDAPASSGYTRISDSSITSNTYWNGIRNDYGVELNNTAVSGGATVVNAFNGPLSIKNGSTIKDGSISVVGDVVSVENSSLDAGSSDASIQGNNISVLGSSVKGNQSESVSSGDLLVSNGANVSATQTLTIQSSGNQSVDGSVLSGQRVSISAASVSYDNVNMAASGGISVFTTGDAAVVNSAISTADGGDFNISAGNDLNMTGNTINSSLIANSSNDLALSGNNIDTTGFVQVVANNNVKMDSNAIRTNYGTYIYSGGMEAEISNTTIDDGSGTTSIETGNLLVDNLEVKGGYVSINSYGDSAIDGLKIDAMNSADVKAVGNNNVANSVINAISGVNLDSGNINLTNTAITADFITGVDGAWSALENVSIVDSTLNAGSGIVFSSSTSLSLENSNLNSLGGLSLSGGDVVIDKSSLSGTAFVLVQASNAIGIQNGSNISSSDFVEVLGETVGINNSNIIADGVIQVRGNNQVNIGGNTDIASRDSNQRVVVHSEGGSTNLNGDTNLWADKEVELVGTVNNDGNAFIKVDPTFTATESKPEFSIKISSGGNVNFSANIGTEKTIVRAFNPRVKETPPVVVPPVEPPVVVPPVEPPVVVPPVEPPVVVPPVEPPVVVPPVEPPVVVPPVEPPVVVPPVVVPNTQEVIESISTATGQFNPLVVKTDDKVSAPIITNNQILLPVVNAGDVEVIYNLGENE